jgi:hypothetical protein
MKQFRLALALALALLVHLPVARADFGQGAIAYAMGQYDIAYQTMIGLASTAHHAYAQYYVGVMNEKGQGVQQSYPEAAKWYRSAAEQGVNQAQYHLALLFEAGKGVPKDLEQAFAWLGVAVRMGNQDALVALARVEKLLNPEELAGAKTLTEELAAKYAKNPPSLRPPEGGPPGAGDGPQPFPEDGWFPAPGEAGAQPAPAPIPAAPTPAAPAAAKPAPAAAPAAATPAPAPAPANEKPTAPTAHPPSAPAKGSGT